MNNLQAFAWQERKQLYTLLFYVHYISVGNFEIFNVSDFQ